MRHSRDAPYHAADELGCGRPATEPARSTLVSVVAPVYNEDQLIDEFHRRVCARWTACRSSSCSSTTAPPTARRCCWTGSPTRDPRVKVVSLSRNFGHQTALTAGLDHARGDAVVMLDADLQDPPELITTMLDHWRAGCDVVYAVRSERAGESRFKLTTARWFYRLFDKLAQVELHHNSGDFRLLDRRALDALLAMRERNRFLRGMTVWVGYTQAAVPYQRDARYAGETKFTVTKMLRFSLDAILSFSDRPLQLATLLGFLISTLAFIAIPVVVVLRILGSYLPGFGAITIAVLLLGGIQLIAIGIIGEYVGRIYDEVKGRPLYLVRARRNMPDPRSARSTTLSATADARAPARTRRPALAPGGIRPDRRVGRPSDSARGRRPSRPRARRSGSTAPDRLGDGIGQVDPVGVGTLGPAALDPHRVAGVADDGRVRRHVVDDDRVGADLRAVADRDRPEHLRARPDRDVVLHGRVALAGGKAGAAERHALIQGHVVADLGGLADHHPHPVVDDEARADLRRRVDLDPGHRARERRDQPRQQRHAGAVQRVREPMGEQRVQARPRGEDLQRADVPGRRITRS